MSCPRLHSQLMADLDPRKWSVGLQLHGCGSLVTYVVCLVLWQKNVRPNTLKEWVTFLRASGIFQMQLPGSREAGSSWSRM